MDIQEAIEHIKAGGKIKYADWNGGFIEFEADSANLPRGVIHFTNKEGVRSQYVASHADLTDPRWEIVNN